MTIDQAEAVSASVAKRVGLPVAATLTSADRIVFAPAGFEANESFTVELVTGWRSADARFVPGNYARPLIEKMGHADGGARAAFVALAIAASKTGKITVRLNGLDFDPNRAAGWPESLQKLEFAVRKNGIVFEELATDHVNDLLTELVVKVFGMAVALIGVDDVEADELALEGAATETISRRYERKPINREICLSVRGRRCYCCDLDFGERYGPEADGFIEVHHIESIAAAGGPCVLNPVADLVPVCSNCHSVLHLRRPPRHPDDLRTFLEPRKNAT